MRYPVTPENFLRPPNDPPRLHESNPDSVRGSSNCVGGDSMGGDGMTNNSDLTRIISRVRSILREAEQAALPCGIRPPNHNAARAKLQKVAQTIEGMLQ
jgi:hypothetical protein